MRCPHCDGTGILDKPDLGSMVVAARKKAGLTQLQLSERVGLSRAQIANLETGRTDIPVSKLFKIAEACGMNPSEIVP